MHRIKRLARAMTFSFLFGIPIWLIGTMFGAMFGQNRSVNRKPKIRYVIFDLGDVLLAQDKKLQLKNIGIINILKLGAGNTLKLLLPFAKPFDIKKTMLEIAEKIKHTEDKTLNALTPDGKQPLAQIFRDWLDGTLSGQKCFQLVEIFIEDHPELFANKTEKNIILRAFQIAFCPETLAKMLKPTKDGIKFVQECKDLGLEVLILSNMDSETGVKLQENHPELFGLFEKKNIFISGDMGMIKPDNKIFETVLYERNLDAQACVFFDDQKENILAAQKCGINAIQCPKKKKLFGSKPNIDYLRQQLAILVAQSELEELETIEITST